MNHARAVLALSAATSFALACSLLTPTDDLLARDSGADTAPPPDSGPPDVAADVQPVDTGPPDAGCGTAGPTTNLVGYWPMDEGKGTTIHDCSPNHIDGTFVALPDGGSPWVQGRTGSAVFASDNAAGCVDIPLPPKFRLVGVFTLSAWVNVDVYPAMGNFSYVFSHNKASPAQGAWRLATIAPQNLEFAGGWDGGGNMQLAGGGAPAKTWTHVAIVFKPSVSVEMYVNGALAAARTTAVPPAFVDDGSTLHLGCRGDAQFPLHGALDEVRVYDAALSIGDIATLAK